MSNITLSISCNSNDCVTDDINNFDNTSEEMPIGESVNDLDRNPRDWFQFTVPLSRNQPIVSADIFLIANAAAATTGTISVGCENATNPAAPTTGADLNGRSMVGAQSATLEAYVNGDTYHYDVDTGVAAVLARSDWVYGSNLAVMIDDVETFKVHKVRSSRHTGGIYRAVLQIVVAATRSARAAGML